MMGSTKTSKTPQKYSATTRSDSTITEPITTLERRGGTGEPRGERNGVSGLRVSFVTVSAGVLFLSGVVLIAAGRAEFFPRLVGEAPGEDGFVVGAMIERSLRKFNESDR
mmetsp:Transcript_20026/g.50507  ORF Transcript_20026/g.50507 Transcript_20026/m.50507 type:complete len:110 (+) Transcript_20026:2391-2720(+)